MRKEKENKCEVCRKRKAIFHCDNEYHAFCGKCGEEDMECPICQPSYLVKD